MWGGNGWLGHLRKLRMCATNLLDESLPASGMGCLKCVHESMLACGVLLKLGPQTPTCVLVLLEMGLTAFTVQPKPKP